MLQDILKEKCKCEQVGTTKDTARKILQLILKKENLKDIPDLDIDALGYNHKMNKLMIIQIRSRDDTGGMTAKSSLVEFLKEMLRKKIKPKTSILYNMAVWDARDSAQKKSTIKKLYTSLSDYIDIKEKEFEKGLERSISLKKNIELKLSYGTEEIARSFYEWTDKRDRNILKSIETIVEKIYKWDDLWVAYVVASLELELKVMKGISNIEIMNSYLCNNGLQLQMGNYKEIVESIENIAAELIKLWDKDTLPVATPKEQLLYIKDLLYLKACFLNQSK